MTHKILVVGESTYTEAVGELGKTYHYIEDFIEDPQKFSLILFTGGADIHPSFYGDKCRPTKPMCFSNIDRDAKEAYIYNLAKKLGIKTCFAKYGSSLHTAKIDADFEIDDISDLLAIIAKNS